MVEIFFGLGAKSVACEAYDLRKVRERANDKQITKKKEIIYALRIKR